MYRKFLNIFVILVMILLLSACTKKITYVDNDYFWKNYVFDNITLNFVTNGRAVDNSFVVTNWVGYSKINDLDSSPITYQINAISTGFDSKPIISNDYIVYLYTNDSSILNVTSLSSNTQSIGISPELVDPKFKNGHFKMWSIEDEFGSMNNNRLIAFIDVPEATYISSYILYFDFSFNANGLYIANKGYLPYTFPPETHIRHDALVLSSIFYQGNFHVYYESGDSPQGYHRIIYPDLSYTDEYIGSQSLSIIDCFIYKDNLWGIKRNRYLSYSDDGSDWTDTSRLSRFFYDIREVGDYLFIKYNDRVYAIGEEDNVLTLYELPQDNLKGRYVTSVSMWKDNVMVTTTNGIFYRPYKDVIQKLQKISSKVDRNLIYPY
jgi:hypothetical protein